MSSQPLRPMPRVRWLDFSVSDQPLPGSSSRPLVITRNDSVQKPRSRNLLVSVLFPASAGKTSRPGLNRSGDRDANNALYRIGLVRVQFHQSTRDYVKRRTALGKTKPAIIRLMRYIAP